MNKRLLGIFIAVAVAVQHLGPAVGVVMALQYHVDVIAVEYRGQLGP